MCVVWTQSQQGLLHLEIVSHAKASQYGDIESISAVMFVVCAVLHTYRFALTRTSQHQPLLDPVYIALTPHGVIFEGRSEPRGTQGVC